MVELSDFQADCMQAVEPAFTAACERALVLKGPADWCENFAPLMVTRKSPVAGIVEMNSPSSGKGLS